VMQESDPNVDEKDAGFSRFSKFVIEAARRGLITLTRLDNGQYEIALGPQVQGAAAQPALAAMSEANEKPRSRGGRGGRGRGRGGRDREEQPTAPAEAAPPEEPAAPAAPAAKSGFSFGDAFGLIKQAVGRIGIEEEPAPQDDGKPASEEPEAPRPVFSAPTPDTEDEDDIPMPTSSAPPPPYSTPSSAPGGIPMRSARFRRGSRGGARRPGAVGGVPEIPKIGVVEVDPNFRPRGDAIPAKPPAPPASPGSVQERGDRGGRGGRGGRGAGGRDRGENGERTERGERGGRGRRGGRGGRGRGPRRFESDSSDSTNHNTRPVAEQTSPSEPPPRQLAPPPPTPPAAPAAAEPGESFWSKVKRGLTGGGGSA